MRSQTEIRQQITSTIIDALASGDLPPWRKPYRGRARDCPKEAADQLAAVAVALAPLPVPAGRPMNGNAIRVVVGTGQLQTRPWHGDWQV